MRNASGAIAWFKKHHEGRSGQCLWTTQQAFGATHKWPSASAGWPNESGKHHGTHPPRGAVVWYTGGSHGYGHVCLSLGGGKIVTTDAPVYGRIGITDMWYPVHHWGLHYVGYTTYISNQKIKGIGGQTRRQGGSKKKDVYISRLHYGQRHSDSVRALQRRLNRVLGLGQSHSKLHVDGIYSAHVDAAVRRWQKKIGDRPDREHRSSIGPKQAAKLFGKRYRIHK